MRKTGSSLLVLILFFSLAAHSSDLLSSGVENEVEKVKLEKINISDEKRCVVAIDKVRNTRLLYLGGVSLGTLAGYFSAQKALAAKVASISNSAEIAGKVAESLKGDSKGYSKILEIAKSSAGDLAGMIEQLDQYLASVRELKFVTQPWGEITSRESIAEIVRLKGELVNLRARINPLITFSESETITFGHSKGAIDASESVIKYIALSKQYDGVLAKIRSATTKAQIALGVELVGLSKSVARSKFALTLLKQAPKFAALLGGAAADVAIGLLTPGDLDKGTPGEWLTSDEVLFNPNTSSSKFCHIYQVYADPEDRAKIEKKIGSAMTLIDQESKSAANGGSGGQAATK